MSRTHFKLALVMGTGVYVAGVDRGMYATADDAGTDDGRRRGTAPATPPQTDPMMQMRANVATLENAIATRNTADAMGALDGIESAVPNVSMGAQQQGTIMAGITRTRRDVSSGAWAAAAREVTTTRSMIYSGGGGGSG